MKNKIHIDTNEWKEISFQEYSDLYSFKDTRKFKVICIYFFKSGEQHHHYFKKKCINPCDTKSKKGEKNEN